MYKSIMRVCILFVCYIIKNRKKNKPKHMVFEERRIIDTGQAFLIPLTTETNPHSSIAPLILNYSNQSREADIQLRDIHELSEREREDERNLVKEFYIRICNSYRHI